MALAVMHNGSFSDKDTIYKPALCLHGSNIIDVTH
jgi:hypothetical protein